MKTMINYPFPLGRMRAGGLSAYTFTALLLAGALAFSGLGCGGEEDDPDDVDLITDTGLGVDTEDVGTGQDHGQNHLYPAEEMKVAFTFSPRDDSGEIKSTDLYITEGLNQYKLEDWKNDPIDLPDIHNVTNPTLKEYGDVDCSQGCHLNPDGSWLLHYEVLDAETNNRKLLLTRMNIGYLFDKSSTRTVATGTDLGRAMFAGSSVVYSRLKGTKEGMDLHAQRLAGDGGDDHLVAEVPSIAGFTTDPNRAKVIIFNATLSCMRIRLANTEGDPDNRQVFIIGDTCSAGGSEFSANEPAAVSPDGNFLAIITKNKVEDLDQRWLRLQMINIGGQEGTLASQFRLGPGGNSACIQDRGEDEYTDATGIAWSPDGQYVYLLARANCGNFDMAESDILRFNVSADGTISGRTNLTKNPKDNFPYSLAIDEFTLSPQGNWMFFTAPTYEWVSTRELYALSTTAYQSPGYSFTQNLIRLTRSRQYTVLDPMARPSR